MNDIELDDFLKKIKTGLQESRKQLLNEYALRNDSLVVGDDNGNVLEVPATLRVHTTLLKSFRTLLNYSVTKMILP